VTSSSLQIPAIAAILGALIAVAWGAFVLPLLGITGPMPGHEFQAYAIAVLPPAAASALLLGGALVGIRRGALAPRLWRIGRNVAFGLAAVLGLASGTYAILVLRALL
jgi:hypothetical protein